MREVYRPVRGLAKGRLWLANHSPADVQRIARRVEEAIDLRICSYAKAENQHREIAPPG